MGLILLKGTLLKGTQTDVYNTRAHIQTYMHNKRALILRCLGKEIVPIADRTTEGRESQILGH